MRATPSKLVPAQTDLGRHYDATRLGNAWLGTYDLDDQPCTHGRWTELIEQRAAERTDRTRDDARWVVAKTERGDVRVSTVWLGLDHSFGDGSPKIYETMVFGGELDEHQWRWSTRAEAAAGHRMICDLVWHARGDEEDR